MKPLSDKTQKCRAQNPATCRYHGSILRMIEAFRKKDAQAYLNARLEAETYAGDDEQGLFKRMKPEQFRDARLEFVEQVNQKLNPLFTPVQSGALSEVWVNPTASAETKARFVEITKKADEKLAASLDRERLAVMSAYTDPTWGEDTGTLDPAGLYGQLNVSLIEFIPTNPTHAHLVHEMVSAVEGQRTAARWNSGEETNPFLSAHREMKGDENLTFKTMFPINSEMEDVPEDLREEAKEELEKQELDLMDRGWLYSLYHGVQEAKNPEFSRAYPNGDAAEKKAALVAFLNKQREHWLKIYEASPTVFNDGAVTAWDTWIGEV